MPGLEQMSHRAWHISCRTVSHTFVTSPLCGGVWCTGAVWSRVLVQYVSEESSVQLLKGRISKYPVRCVCPMPIPIICVCLKPSPVRCVCLTLEIVRTGGHKLQFGSRFLTPAHHYVSYYHRPRHHNHRDTVILHFMYVPESMCWIQEHWNLRVGHFMCQIHEYLTYVY